MKPTEYGRSDAMSFPRLDHRRHGGFCLPLSTALGETRCHVLRTLRQPQGEAHLAKN